MRMKSKKRLQLIIFIIVLAIAGYTVASGTFKGEQAPPAAGDKVLSFSLQGLDEQSYDPAQFRGHPVIINFWGSFCPPCVEETPALQRMHEKYKDKGVVILGVNLGERPLVRVQNFADRFGVTYPILLDPELAIRDRFGVRSYPTTFFVDKTGTVSEVKVGGMTEGYIEAQILRLLDKD